MYYIQKQYTDGSVEFDCASKWYDLYRNCESFTRQTGVADWYRFDNYFHYLEYMDALEIEEDLSQNPAYEMLLRIGIMFDTPEDEPIQAIFISPEAYAVFHESDLNFEHIMNWLSLNENGLRVAMGLFPETTEIVYFPERIDYDDIDFELMANIYGDNFANYIKGDMLSLKS